MVILFAILLFSVLIFLHELGHFMAAKLSKVRVNEFSIFMGPALIKWQRGETLYAIRCIPIGGYCAMEGENEDTDDPHSFQKASWLKRLIILISGSAMNFLAGLILFAVVFMQLDSLPTTTIVEAEQGSTVVSETGLQVGDEILEIDGENVYIAGDFDLILGVKGGDVHDFVVLRNGQEVVIDDLKMEKHLFVDEDGKSAERYGFTFGTEDVTFGNLAGYVWNNSLDTVRNVRLSLQMLVTGQASVKDVSGPVGIVQIMSETAQSSEDTGVAINKLLLFGAFIAINLAVMNMLPIPALDGGRALCLLLTTAVEKITKKKINPKYESYIHGVGMILLLTLMALIMFKDVWGIFAG